MPVVVIRVVLTAKKQMELITSVISGDRSLEIRIFSRSDLVKAISTAQSSKATSITKTFKTVQIRNFNKNDSTYNTYEFIHGIIVSQL